MKNLMNTCVRTALVAKVDLGAFLTPEQVAVGLVSNLNDCFLISEEFANNMETAFKLPKSYVESTKDERNFRKFELEEKAKEFELYGVITNDLTPEETKELENLRRIEETGISYVMPMPGDKFIGVNRDKGSVTDIMSAFKPVCKMNFENVEITKNFFETMLQMGKKVEYVSDTEFNVEVDVIANPSTERDNVSALVLNSLLEWDAIATGKEYEISPEQLLAIEVADLAEKYPCSFEVVMQRRHNGEEVYSFGKVPMMLEDFFWQPQHGNQMVIKEKEVSLNYNQARDAIKVLTPTLGKVMKETMNFASMKEDMLLLGLDLNYTAVPTFVVEETIITKSGKTIEEEIM